MVPIRSVTMAAPALVLGKAAPSRTLQIDLEASGSWSILNPEDVASALVERVLARRQASDGPKRS